MVSDTDSYLLVSMEMTPNTKGTQSVDADGGEVGP